MKLDQASKLLGRIWGTYPETYVIVNTVINKESPPDACGDIDLGKTVSALKCSGCGNLLEGSIYMKNGWILGGCCAFTGSD